MVQGSPSEGGGRQCRQVARTNPPVGVNRLVHEANGRLRGYGRVGRHRRGDGVGVGGAVDEVRQRGDGGSGIRGDGNSTGGVGGGRGGRVGGVKGAAGGVSTAVAEAATALVVRRQSSLARLAKAVGKSRGRGGGPTAVAAAREAAAAQAACFSTAAAVTAAEEVGGGGGGGGGVKDVAGCGAYNEGVRAFTALAARRCKLGVCDGEGDSDGAVGGRVELGGTVAQ